MTYPVFMFLSASASNNFYVSISGFISQLQTWVPNWSSEHLYWNVRNWSHFLCVIPSSPPPSPTACCSYVIEFLLMPPSLLVLLTCLLICFYIDLLITTHCISSLDSLFFFLCISFHCLFSIIFLKPYLNHISFLFKVTVGSFFSLSLKYLLTYLAVLGS